jgi:hypothetical protein
MNLLPLGTHTKPGQFILESPLDWQTWLSIRRDFAKHTEVWDYVNPESDSVAILNQPKRPTPVDVNKDAKSVASLTHDERHIYSIMQADYQIDRQGYYRKLDAIHQIYMDCLSLISRRYVYIVLGAATAHDRLRALQHCLAPTLSANREVLSKGYREIQTPPYTLDPRQVNAWLDAWICIVAMGKKVNLPATRDDLPQEDFLVACRDILPKYANAALMKLKEKELDNKEIPSLLEYVAEVRADWTEAKHRRMR